MNKTRGASVKITIIVFICETFVLFYKRNNELKEQSVGNVRIYVIFV